jgi:hypothetical protein
MTSLECKTFCPASQIEEVRLTMKDCSTYAGMTTGTVSVCNQFNCEFKGSLKCLLGKRYGVASKQ